jgi:hypothetical protein
MIQKLRHQAQASGQAIVEFALAATLIFTLLAAAVDLGLIFFSLQGLNNAAQEGATYGSRWLVGEGTTASPRTFNENEIKERIRKESGERGGIGFANLLDLNSSGTLDLPQGARVGDAGCEIDADSGLCVLQDYIQIQMLKDLDGDGNPAINGGAPSIVPCANPANEAVPCYVYVTVSMNYDLVFPLAPVFGDRVRLSSSYYVPVRDGFARGGQPLGTPITIPENPPAQPLQLAFTSLTDGQQITDISQTAFSATATDPSGGRITRVTFTVRAPNGTATQVTLLGEPYCVFGKQGNTCKTMPANMFAGKGTFTIEMRAQSSSQQSSTSVITFVVP